MYHNFFKLFNDNFLLNWWSDQDQQDNSDPDSTGTQQH